MPDDASETVDGLRLDRHTHPQIIVSQADIVPASVGWLAAHATALAAALQLINPSGAITHAFAEAAAKACATQDLQQCRQALRSIVLLDKMWRLKRNQPTERSVFPAGFLGAGFLGIGMRLFPIRDAHAEIIGLAAGALAIGGQHVLALARIVIVVDALVDLRIFVIVRKGGLGERHGQQQGGCEKCRNRKLHEIFLQVSMRVFARHVEQ
jgi:hypothetical protein